VEEVVEAVEENENSEENMLGSETVDRLKTVETAGAAAVVAGTGTAVDIAFEYLYPDIELPAPFGEDDCTCCEEHRPPLQCLTSSGQHTGIP
jgi:hypothetical protein